VSKNPPRVPTRNLASISPPPVAQKQNTGPTSVSCLRWSREGSESRFASRRAAAPTQREAGTFAGCDDDKAEADDASEAEDDD